LVWYFLPSHLLPKSLKIKMCKTVILPVIYGLETWSCMLREEHRLRGCNNRGLRKILVLKWEKVTGCRRKLH